MRVSFDSNAWETIFDEPDTRWEPILGSIVDGRIEGFVCEIGFRIEAIMKSNRTGYFSRPYMEVRGGLGINADGTMAIRMSIGPNDAKHPGLPVKQAAKFKKAMDAGFKLMRGHSWLGLPGPPETQKIELFVPETAEVGFEREQRQHDVTALIDARGVGRAAFDAVDGWFERSRENADEKALSKACAEWADGELVAAHIAYGHEILCTDDRAKGTGRSVFDAEHRTWLSETFGVRFATLKELATLKLHP
ncbi:hypothetical protein [Flavisphingomonas formosensis]|uniref:hypothetical protein n=1 Tax=Flavisphingomonas formosensis TaxID=861534 RepID=UPI0012FA502E|nr:hypothetical protein [Sphingomonas formosensis]